MIQLLKNRLYSAFTTSISASQLGQLLLPIFVLTALLLLIGFKFSFLKIQVFNGAWIEGIKIAAISFVMPALSEEIFFRVLLLPHPSEITSIHTKAFWVVISIASFIIYHPVQGMLWNPSGYYVFIKPVFLILAALLGVTCTLAYLGTGSIWLAVTVHWLAVVIWLLLLDGFAKFIAN